MQWLAGREQLRWQGLSRELVKEDRATSRASYVRINKASVSARPVPDRLVPDDHDADPLSAWIPGVLVPSWVLMNFFNVFQLPSHSHPEQRPMFRVETCLVFRVPLMTVKKGDFEVHVIIHHEYDYTPGYPICIPYSCPIIRFQPTRRSHDNCYNASKPNNTSNST